MVQRETVAQFYADFWGKPGALNHGHTIHEYWMEQSRGKIGIPKIDVYGPYRMPRKLFEYGLNEYNQTSGCPAGFTCRMRACRLPSEAATRSISSSWGRTKTWASRDSWCGYSGHETSRSPNLMCFIGPIQRLGTPLWEALPVPG